jgi:hypothetical protein
MCLIAIIAPEWTAMWALRQLLHAIRLRDQYNEMLGIPKESWSFKFLHSVGDRILQTPRWFWFQVLSLFGHSFEKVVDNYKDANDGERINDIHVYYDMLICPWIGRWTLTHGFFMGMGGFILVHEDCQVFPIVLGEKFYYTNVKVDEEGQRTVHPRIGVIKPEHFDFKSFNSLEQMELNMKFKPAVILKRTISEGEIKDWSNSDILAKSIILIQLIWFSVQIMARVIQRLPITLLEITTVAYIAVSMILYGIWWKKPKDIRYPVNIMLSTGGHQEMYQNDRNEPPNGGEHWTAGLKRLFFTASFGDEDITTSQMVPTFYSGREIV